MNYKENPLGTQPIGKLLLKFCIPSIIAMVVNSIYNIADQIFIQRGVGTNGNAATTVAFPMITFTLAISLLICVGGAAMASIKMGEHNNEEAEHILGNSFTLVLIVSIAVVILSFIFFEPLLKLLGASNEVMPYAKDYMGIILLGTVFMAIGSGMSTYLRIDGAPIISMLSLVLGCGINIVLDPVLIFNFNMGVKGAAIATICSQFISAVVVMWYLLFKGNIRIKLKYMKINFNLSKTFCVLGLSSFITQFANAIVQIISNNLLQYYGNKTSGINGDIAMTAMGLTMKTNMIIIGICVGIGTGAQPILGYNRGAKNYKRNKETYIKCVIAASIVSITGWAFAVFKPDVVLSIYGNNDPVLFEFAKKTMRIFLGLVCVAGFSIVSSGYFQAVGHAKSAFMLSMARQVIALLPLIIILPLFMGVDGVLVAGPLADIIALIIGIIYVRKEMIWLNTKIKEQNA